MLRLFLYSCVFIPQGVICKGLHGPLGKERISVLVAVPCWNGIEGTLCGLSCARTVLFIFLKDVLSSCEY